MPDLNFTRPTRSYFAAANGYSGFRSYFEDIFSPDKMDRVFILKGGPGTGKSGFMKRVLNIFSEEDDECDAIYCSSDIRSLDGVVIKRGDVSVAVIDGTAPHEKLMKYPGVCESIIDLGAFWDEDKLCESKDRIIELSKEKYAHYKRAYTFLSRAGDINTHKRSIIEDLLDKRCLQDICSEIFKKLSNIKCGRKEDIRLISCFGKEGYKSIPVAECMKKSTISVGGAHGSAELLLGHLLSILRARGTDMTYYPSPFSHEIPEAVSVSGCDTFIFKDTGASCDIDCNKLLKAEAYDSLSRLENAENIFTEAAGREFALASEAHFALESIYSPAMHFDMVDECALKTIEKIKNILKKAK